ncbi:MAG: MFS transporter [Candidatus Omnitrophica bacterium]|nr:MFS transporter [Candidatus Omnitrophota bacterium]MDD5574567.1 MFS transporter [Candidatus Omnitrophota bacterium]
MARFRSVLKNRNFSLLWLAQIISQFGDRLDQMALIALVYRYAPGSTTQMAKIMAFTIIPVFLIGPIAGVYVDRWDRRRTMVVCDLLRGALILLIPLWLMRLPSLWPVYIVVFIVFSIARFYVPAKMSIIPDLVRSEDLLLANSLVNTTGMVAAMFGFGLGGILVGMVGAKGGFTIDAVSFLVSGAMLFFLSAKAIRRAKKESLVEVGKDIAEVIRKSAFQEMKETVLFLRNDPRIGSCFGVLFLLWGALGSVYVVSIVFVQEAFASVTKDLGLLVVALGLGLFVGSLSYGRLGHKDHGLGTIFTCILGAGVVLSAFVLTVLHLPYLVLAMGLVFLLGLVVSPVMVISNTMVHQLTDHSMRGKIFSSLEVVVHLAFLASMMVTAPLADRIGSVKILLGVSVFLVLVGAGGMVKVYGQDRRA